MSACSEGARSGRGETSHPSSLSSPVTLHGVTILSHFVNPALKILHVDATSQKEMGGLMVTKNLHLVLEPISW